MAPRLSCFVDECADDENYLLISDAHRMSGVVSFFSHLSPVESCVIPPVLFTNHIRRGNNGRNRKK